MTGIAGGSPVFQTLVSRLDLAKRQPRLWNTDFSSLRWRQLGLTPASRGARKSAPETAEAMTMLAETLESSINTLDTPDQRVLLVPLAALGGADCEAACEVCPLRAWKSKAQGSIYCLDVLAKHRTELEGWRRG